MDCARNLVLCFGLATALSTFSPRADADQIMHSAITPMTATDYDVAVPTPKFDSALGTLTSVSVTIEVQASVSAGVENTDGTPAMIALTLGAEGEAYAADDGSFVTAVSGTTTIHSLSAFDGTDDFGGTSGLSIATTTLTSTTATGARSDSGVLALYAGPPGNPGTAGTRVRATGIGVLKGDGVIHSMFTTQAAFLTVVVAYDYTPRWSVVCAGDGSGTACPCSNESSTPTGCLNSYGWGSQLGASGAAAVSADSLVLSANVPGSNAALFYQGTALSNGGAGAVFGDGLRCTDGTVVRLATTAGVGGIATFPASGDPLVSVAGGVPSGATRYYQVWYRNSAEFCTADTFNFSNALRIDWGT
jgi:hypothetical protein